MKKQIVLLLAAYIITSGISSFAKSVVPAVRVGETNPSVSAYVFGTGEQLSGQQFQTDGILTYKGYQYTVYYNLSRNVCIARRKMPVGAWEEVMLPYKNSVDDAHNVICMGICHNDGSIHLSYDHHNDPLHYSYSIKGSANDPENMPWEASSFSETTSMMDQSVPDVTYPRFISKPDGNLLFECRFHYSGYGDSYLREYDAATKKWTLIGRYVQGMDVTPDACAYINGMTYDNQDRLHVTWCWRDDFGGGSNHDFYYAYSEDHGRTWKDNKGEKVATTQYMLPVVDVTTGSGLTQKLKDKLMIESIPYNKGYINQETQAVDSKGRIHAVNSHIPMNEGTDSNWSTSRQKARLHHRYRDTDGTWKTIQIKNNGATVNSYCRVSLSFDKFDNAYVVANGAEVYFATAANNYEDWDLLSNVDKGRFLSEPLVDRPLLMNDGVLSFVYLGVDKKITVIDYLTKNPNTPNGTGLLAEYFSDDSFKQLIGSEIVAGTDKGTIPSGTKSIRWSGAFETIEGEQYTLYVNTADETSVFVNNALAKSITKADNAQEYDFKYTLIASHKNNIVIESKTSSVVTLSWSSDSTVKGSVPTTSLYSEKANGVPGEVTPPVLSQKVELDDILLNEEKTISGSLKNTFIIPFDPVGDYSLEVKTQVNSADGRGMDIEARAKNGKGFRFSLDTKSINNINSTSSLNRVSLIDNTEEKVFRFVVKGEKVYVYCDKEYIGTSAIEYVGNIQEDDTETDPFTYGSDIISEWAGANNAGTGSPTAYGWDAAGGTVNWNSANGSSGVRYLDITAASNPKHLLNGDTYTGRLLTIRWDGALSSVVYYYPVTLEANTSYDFSMVYEHWNNGAIGAPISVGISKEKLATGIYESASFVTVAKNTLQEGSFKFVSQEAGVYYLCFTGASGTMFGIGDLALKSYTSDNHVQIGKNYNGGSLDSKVFYVTYQEGAFAPGDQDSEVEEPELPKKQTLPTSLQSAIIINAVDGSKNVSTLSEFDPLGDYSLEVSTTVSSAEGRGLEFEPRTGSGYGFRTSLSNTSFRWIAPYANAVQLAKADNTKQIVRYAVQGDKVYIYKNGEYVNSGDITKLGYMNAVGTTEEDAKIVKPDNINDANNLIGNPDFAATAHNAAPTSWLSDKTMGTSPNSRVQQKENTTELSAYSDGKKAFVIRFDGSGGTYYSYPVTLKTNQWYEYSFDLITWGENQNKEFDVVISTIQDASDNIVATQTVKTPSVRTTAERQSVRFRTTTAAAVTEMPYYLVFKKKSEVGTIGITDLYLDTNSINALLFGKNYTEGAANIAIDYITVDYSGAFAPEAEGPGTSIPEITTTNDILVYSQNGYLNVKATSSIEKLVVFDMLGRCVANQACSGNICSVKLDKGMYIANVYTKGGVSTSKVVIK